MNKSAKFGILALGFVLFHCSNDCPKQWAKTFIEKPGTPQNQDLTAIVEDQHLVLLSSQSQGKQSLMLTSKEMVQGDFKATFTYEDLDLTAPGMSLAVLLVPDLTPDTTFFSSISYNSLSPTPNPKAVLLGEGQMQDGGAITISSMNTVNGTSNQRAGSISIERAGATVTVTFAPIGETPLTYSQTMIRTDPIHIGLQFGNLAQVQPSTVSSVRITDFTVTGGGGTVQSDSFSCNSIE